MRVETVFLDAGGVLVHPNWGRVSEALGRQGLETDPAALAAADFHARRALDDAARIRTTTDASRGGLYFDLVLARAGLAASDATRAALEELRAYHAVHNLWEHVPPDVPAALARLRGLGLRLVVVSNANGTLAVALERTGLARLVDHALDSHHEGVEKPDPRFFQLALARAGATPESTVHVGDLFHIDVVGARKAGLRAILFDAAGLYADYDCPRVSSLSELADGLSAPS
jgi:putative hydrolase of the HAD superfamily